MYLINLVTGDLVPLSVDIETNEFEEQTPSWWPDGSRVAYSSDVNGNADIFDTNPFTGDVRHLVTSETDLVMPAISPDGNQIAFVELLEEEAHIYVGDLQVRRKWQCCWRYHAGGCGKAHNRGRAQTPIPLLVS